MNRSIPWSRGKMSILMMHLFAYQQKIRTELSRRYLIFYYKKIIASHGSPFLHCNTYILQLEFHLSNPLRAFPCLLQQHKKWETHLVGIIRCLTETPARSHQPSRHVLESLSVQGLRTCSRSAEYLNIKAYEFLTIKFTLSHPAIFPEWKMEFINTGKEMGEEVSPKRNLRERSHHGVTADSIVALFEKGCK